MTAAAQVVLHALPAGDPVAEKTDTHFAVSSGAIVDVTHNKGKDKKDQATPQATKGGALW